MRIYAKLLLPAALAAGAVTVPATSAHAECHGLTNVLIACIDPPTVNFEQRKVIDVDTCLVINSQCVLPVDEEVVLPVPAPTATPPTVDCQLPPCPEPLAP